MVVGCVCGGGVEGVLIFVVVLFSLPVCFPQDSFLSRYLFSVRLSSHSVVF